MPLYQEEPAPIAQVRRRRSETQAVTDVSWSEMLALTTGRELLAGLSGTFFHEAAITALEKIRTALPAEIAARAEAAADVLVADRRPARDYKGRGDLVRTLAEAVRRRETVTLGYRKVGAGRPEERLVDPPPSRQ